MLEKLFKKTKYIDIIAGDVSLKSADIFFAKIGKEYYLSEILEPIKEEYDFIIIDTPPNLGIMVNNALTASNYIIVPMEPNRDSMQGLSQLVEIKFGKNERIKSILINLAQDRQEKIDI